mmetsp:Transcript_41054/g.117128  ORF Transcript_41054/g.117128 Transcript_41054/m.117128 type:complete len:233 (-) Transcript_41054:188-886(-)
MPGVIVARGARCVHGAVDSRRKPRPRVAVEDEVLDVSVHQRPADLRGRRPSVAEYAPDGTAEERVQGPQNQEPRDGAEAAVEVDVEDAHGHQLGREAVEGPGPLAVGAPVQLDHPHAGAALVERPEEPLEAVEGQALGPAARQHRGHQGARAWVMVRGGRDLGLTQSPVLGVRGPQLGRVHAVGQVRGVVAVVGPDPNVVEGVADRPRAALGEAGHQDLQARPVIGQHRVGA